MDSRGDSSSRFGQYPTISSRNMSSSSSTAFFSANQSPSISPKTHQELSESTRSDAQYCDSFDPLTSSSGFQDPELEFQPPRDDHNAYTSSASVSYNRVRSCDVFLGLHGQKPSLLRFADWLRAELELQGMSCFTSDRARCSSRRITRKQRIIEKAMDGASFGVIILTRESFKNPYTIEELRFFSGKKNLVPVFFDLSREDCHVRDIVEKRGELWEKHGGELWECYGGIEREWREAVHGLSRVDDDWKLEAHEGNWRDCVFRTVTLVAMRLVGRRSVVERLAKWRDKAEKEEFPYPRNERFVGRKKELSELEFVLFGDEDYFELKAATRRKSKGKEKVVWNELEKEIEMQKLVRKTRRKKRSLKIVCGKGVACVSGEAGIGKTELLLEFAYRHHQRYKMVLWIGGESRYIRQNYLNLYQYLDVDVGVENCSDRARIKSFEEREDTAVSRIRRELMRDIPFLLVIDNLESEKDWWDSKLVMDLLPRFGGGTHVLISTRLSRVMNVEPLKLPYLSAAEAMELMQGNVKDYPVQEMDALRVIEEKLGRLTLGLAIVGAILSELPISPSRLLDTINRMPLREMSSSCSVLRRSVFLLQLFEVCFSIFDHADGPTRSLATRMVVASGWLAPGPVPASLLALAASKLPEKHKGGLWSRLRRAISCGFASSKSKRSGAEAASMLLRFNIARASSVKLGFVQIHELVRLYARNLVLVNETAPAMVRAVINRGWSVESADQIWAVCFLLFGFSNEAPSIHLKITELLFLVKQVILPLAIRTFVTFSRCGAAVELLRVCTNALEAADQTLVKPVEKWLDKSLCWRSVQTSAQLNPNLWEELALARATVLETRAKLMLRGGQFGVADDLIRKAIFIRTSISGEDHPGTVSARETLSKLTRLSSNVHQIHNTSP
ncbi:Disease resistance protein [Hirschfeldia incana]|nr:Disease resistance protein [Hirschfeldia incana]